MARMAVLRREPIGIKTGLDRYADYVEDCLRANPIEYETIELNISMRRGLPNLVKGTLRPMLRCVLSREGRTVHATDELCAAAFPFIRGRKIVTVHHVPRPGEYRGRLYEMLWMSVVRMAVRHADMVIAQSEATRSDAIEAFGLPAEKVIHIRNPVAPVFRPTAAKEDVVACMGMFIPRKNMAASIEAFRLLAAMPGMSGYRLRICGHGPEKEALIAKARDLGLEGRTEFIEGLSDEGMAEFYSKAKLVLNTSLHEGLGYVTLEAQACGTPVLYLKSSSIPEDVTREAVACDGVEDMARKAHAILTGAAAYDDLVGRGVDYASSFGSGFCQRTVDALTAGGRE